MLIAIALVVLAYLFGSVSSAIIVARVMGLPDPRGQGSGNPGATNVLRYGGRKAGALTLLGDTLKGTLPVLAALALGLADRWLAAVGLAAFAGHLLPAFFRFKGGKGIATGLGVILGWSWPAFLLAIGTWLAVAAVTRISSLAALVAFLLAPVYVYAFTASPALTAAMAVMTVVTYWRHRSNIRNLLAGTEGRIGAGR